MIHLLLFCVSTLMGLPTLSSAQELCFEDDALNNIFLPNGVSDLEGSCCQNQVCAIPCPEEVAAPAIGFGVAVCVAIGIFVLIGLSTIFFIKDKSENYFVAGRSLPLWVVTLTLGSQSLDSNALLGNADLSYKYHFFDGAVLPIGLGLSLILNGLFLARHIHRENVLTLPDVFAKKYGKVVEIMTSLSTITSFLFLLAGNLVGMATILSYLLGMGIEAAIWMSGLLVLIYTIAGGLFSVAYTDVVQAAIGWIGSITFAAYMIHNAENNAPPVSIGFPGYMYFEDSPGCELYNGTACSDDNPGRCCYNEDLWCPPGGDFCRTDNGAYPYGDIPVFLQEMSDPSGLFPFPNAIVFNWATIFVLGFGNLAALDFQARCMASKTATIATVGCIVAGLLTFAVGVPFSYLGAITRTFYGPDTPRAEFLTDTCSRVLELPTCALWLPDPQAFIKLLTHEAPAFLGGWALICIIAASMSTCDGAILAMGTVFSHNIIRNVGCGVITNKNLLTIARIASIPFTILAIVIASYYKSNHSLGATGYLLIVAFDIVLASTVVPLFGCFYTKKPSPLAATLAIISGALTRVILEFTLPKDGFVIAPFPGDEFLDYGAAANDLFPPFFDVPADQQWTNYDDCEQERLRDFTGVDSLAAPLVCLIVFVLVQILERNGPIIDFKEGGIMSPYTKDTSSSDSKGDKLDEDYEK